MTTDAEKTGWSLPGPDEMPRDKLNLQLEVYDETILLRGFEGGSVRCRGSHQTGEALPMPPEGRFLSVSARWSHICVLLEGESVRCWGC